MSVSTDAQLINELLTRGVSEVIDKETLEKKLANGEKLRIKLGIDPTSPNLHLGRSIPLLKLRDFQELGHQVVFIIGDFTGVIGDTSDKDAERPMLEEKTIQENMKAYAEQAGKILDMDKCEVHYNSEWLSKLGFAEIGQQANAFSVAEFTARENIRRRLDDGKRVSLREMLYPLMQGYDSVAIKADVELGGMDQRFNLLAGRKLQELNGQAPQAIVMGPLVNGFDGRKMSSSYGNTVNITENPTDMYGSLMRTQDDLIIEYFTLMTRVPMETVKEYEQAMASGANPKEFKMKLAFEITRYYHSEEDAKAAEEHFTNTFSKKQVPENIPEVTPSNYDLVTTLIEAGFAKSKSEARRAIEQGGVKVNDEKVTAIDAEVQSGDLIQKGKRFFVTIK